MLHIYIHDISHLRVKCLKSHSLAGFLVPDFLYRIPVAVLESIYLHNVSWRCGCFPQLRLLVTRKCNIWRNSQKIKSNQKHYFASPLKLLPSICVISPKFSKPRRNCLQHFRELFFVRLCNKPANMATENYEVKSLTL